MSLSLTHQFISEITLLGMAFDAVGGLYLAYDLLGGKSGPLRTVTRTGSYIALFLLGYAVVLGIRYAIVASLGMGFLLAAEYRVHDKNSVSESEGRPRVLVFGILRGIVVGLAAMTFAGVAFGALFGLLSAVGLTLSYAFGFTPTADYETNSIPRVTRHKATASVLRAIAIALAGLIAASITLHGQNSLILGLRLGVAAGIVSGLVGLFSPMVEWWIENIPERRLGVIGFGLIFVGMILQSAQYWVVVFDISVR